MQIPLSAIILYFLLFYWAGMFLFNSEEVWKKAMGALIQAIKYELPIYTGGSLSFHALKQVLNIKKSWSMQAVGGITKEKQ